MVQISGFHIFYSFFLHYTLKSSRFNKLALLIFIRYFEYMKNKKIAFIWDQVHQNWWHIARDTAVSIILCKPRFASSCLGARWNKAWKYCILSYTVDEGVLGRCVFDLRSMLNSKHQAHWANISKKTSNWPCGAFEFMSKGLSKSIHK